jgi:phosphotransferase system, enzyme I, PtsP
LPQPATEHRTPSLELLQRIMTEVSAARSLAEALRIVVQRVREGLATEVCSIYLSEDGENFVLMATEGLNQAAVGRVRLHRSEGVTGLVAERREPVHLERASEHPRYKYFPVTGEERCQAFLGVPIIHFGHVLGVLVTQQQEERLFSKNDTAFLVTIAAQLAGALQHAAATGGLKQQITRRGSSVSYAEALCGTAGIAIGTLVVAFPEADLNAVPDREAGPAEEEERMFLEAVAAVRGEIEHAAARMTALIKPEELAIFNVHAMMLHTSGRLVGEVLDRIRAGQWAQAALRDTWAANARVFEQMDEGYIRTRAEDIRDIGRRVLQKLQRASTEPRPYPRRCILVGEEISIAQVAEVPSRRLVGIVSVRGSAYSHTAVLARALGIPAVLGFDDLPLGRLDGEDAVIDANQARLFIAPPASVLNEFRRALREQEEIGRELAERKDLPARTRDGRRMLLYVNTGLLSDISPTLDSGADGVGLYRTEVPFLVRDAFPDEDEQAEVYRKVLTAFAPAPVHMRTLDVGGDKTLPYFRYQEDNPFLGWRGIRVTLDHPEIFATQLRAMLRADVGVGNLRILFPMVTSLDEVDAARVLLEEAFRELQSRGLAVRLPQVGVMVEVPSAVYLAVPIARRVDFLSIGSNDLTQYVLAADRGNARVARIADGLHPAVLHAFRQTIEAARQEHKPVNFCGEMAADPLAVVLALGLGANGMSMAASAVPRAKAVVRGITARRARGLAERALAMESPGEVRALLTQGLERAGLGHLLPGAASRGLTQSAHL